MGSWITDLYEGAISWFDHAWQAMPYDQQLRGVLQLVAGIIAAIVAISGLRTWRRQLHGSLEAERSLAFMDALWGYANAAHALSYSLHDLIHVDDFPPDLRERRLKWCRHQLEKQNENAMETQAHFNREWGRAQALWGVLVFASEVNQITNMCQEVVNSTRNPIATSREFKYMPGSEAFLEWWQTTTSLIEGIRRQLGDVLPTRRFKYQPRQDVK